MSETESYMWGLGVAGIFHLWEHETRKFIVNLQKNPLNSVELDKLNDVGFKRLCEEIEKTGFAVTKRPSFRHLETAWLITNTIKHGEGKAFRQLVAKKPELNLHTCNPNTCESRKKTSTRSRQQLTKSGQTTRTP